MSRILTGEKLIASVRKRGMFPEDTDTFDDQDILDIANEEMDVSLLDKLTSLHEEHLTVHVDIPKNSTGHYDIPVRAVGNKIRDVSLIIGQTVYELTQIGIGELSDYSTFDDGGYNLDKFYIQNNQIKLISNGRAYESVRIYYHLRPNVLVKEADTGKVQNVNQNGNIVTLTLSNVPKRFTEIIFPSIKFDVVAYETPNKIKYQNLSATFDLTTRTATITLNSTDTLDIRVGDWLCKAEESPVPNIPTEMHPLLAQLTAVHMLEATGDSEALKNAEARLQKMMTSVTELIDDRVDLAPRKIRPRHGVLSDSIAGNGNYRRRRGR